MTQEELLNSCRNFFNRTQLSWSTYFSKWEAMAQEENIDDLDEQYLAYEEHELKIPKKKKSATRKYNKHAGRSRKNSRCRLHSKKELRKETKKVRCRTSNRERGNEIIHKTENQTNLECEVVNNKHFEADLKAIFIEILSENTNKMGMFSVLSRMFPGNENTISNFSLGSVIMERNKFSIYPISYTILHSASRSEFFCRGMCPCGPEVTERKYASVGLRNFTETADRSHLYVRDHMPHLNGSYIKRPRSLFHKEMWLGEINNHRSSPAQVSDVIGSENPVYLNGENAFNSTLCNWSSVETNTPQLNTSLQCSNQSRDNGPTSLTSPEMTLREILSPSRRISSKPLRSHRQNRKRKKVNPPLCDSDDDSGDEKNNGNADSSPGRFPRICSTPKRPRRINSEEKNSALVTEDLDDEVCFNIIDRVTNTGA